MTTNRYQLIAPPDLENYANIANDIAGVAWPEFMLHDPIADEYWPELFDRFEEYQFALMDQESNQMAVMGNSVPFHWDQPADELPEGGWDWVFVKAVEDHKKGLQPTIQSAIQVAIRPNEKSKYPLISIEDYIQWEAFEGLPFDAWLRVHARAGAKIIKPCHDSMTIRGRREEWEEWTGIKFPQSGAYTIPGALKPIEMNIESDEGVYVEPNVWMQHVLI